MNRSLRLIAFAFLLLLGVFFVCAPAAPRLIAQQHLSQNAIHRLDSAFERNMKAFGEVSLLKGLLSIVEGSSAGASVGASVQVQVGDVVEPLYDYVNFVWEMLLFSLFVISLYKLVLESGVLGIGVILLGAGICGLILSRSLGAKRLTRRTRLLSKQTMAAGLLIAFGLPIAILLSDAIAARFIAPLEARAAQELSHVSEDFKETFQQFADLRANFSIFHPGDSVQAMFDAANLMAAKSQELAKRSSKAAFYFVGVQLFSLLFLPMMLMVVGYGFRPKGPRRILLR